MFNKTKIIKSIRTFKVFNDKLLSVNNAFQLFEDETLISDKVLDSDYCSFINRNLFVSENSSFIEDEEFESLFYVRGSEDLESNTLIFSGDFKLQYPDFSNKYYLYNLKTKTKTFLFEFLNLFSFLRIKERILLSNKNSVELFILSDNVFKWQFSLEPLGTYSNKYTREEKPYEIGHFIGVWQNELLIACTGSLILSLDIATGKEIRRWQNLPNTIDDFLKDVFESKIPGNEYIYHLNKAEDSIIAYFLSYQLHINLASGNITITNYKEALAEKNIEHFQYKSGYAEDDTHLYTTVNYDGKALGLKYTPTGIIAFNKLKGIVDWDFRFDQIKGDYVSVQVPQYANGKLYQLTQDKNLYIFEKENLNG